MSEQHNDPAELNRRIDEALDIAQGAPWASEERLRWLVDQMVRALCGCDGAEGENEAYREFIRVVGTWRPGSPE